MFAIYNKTNNRVVSKHYGEATSISLSYTDVDFGYVETTDAELNGDPKEYDVINGKVQRRSIDAILSEIESNNPLLKELNRMKHDNDLLGQQTVDLDLRLLMGGM
jgi:hypothetical protein